MEVDEGQGEADRVRSFVEAAGLGVAVSSVVGLGSLNGVSLDGLTTALESLVNVSERLSTFEQVDQLQRSLLDIAEFLVTYKESLCTQDRDKLPALRKLAQRFEDLVEKSKAKIDYRVLSLFMENKVGETAVNEQGPIVSEFNKIKSKLHRGVTLSFEERERLIEKLLSNVHDKRRGFLIEGRPEVRGYRDMSDQELQGWWTLAGELTDSTAGLQQP